MPTLLIDATTRRAIARAILDSTDQRKTYRVIPLPDGNGQLLMLGHCGNIAFNLITDGDDLLDSYMMQDVSELVRDDLEANWDWGLVVSGEPVDVDPSSVREN